MIDVGTLMLGRQERAVPQDGKANRAPRAQHDVSGEVFILCAQSVQEPSPHAGPRWNDRAVVHRLLPERRVPSMGSALTPQKPLIGFYRP